MAVQRGAVYGVTGRQFTNLVFTNTSQTACALRGFPGVAGVDAAGHQLAQATRVGPTGAVDLVPGATAYARLGAENIDTTGVCPQRAAGLLVTPPNTTRSTPLPGDSPLCAPFDIEAVTAAAP